MCMHLKFASNIRKHGCITRLNKQIHSDWESKFSLSRLSIRTNEDTITEDSTYFGYRTWRNQAGTDMEASFLLPSFHNSRRSYTVGENLSVVFTAATTCQARCVDWCNRGMTVKGAINNSLIIWRPLTGRRHMLGTRKLIKVYRQVDHKP